MYFKILFNQEHDELNSSYLVIQSIPIVSSLNEPSSFSKPHTIVPSGFSSRHFLKICATGFFGLSSE